MAFPVVETTAKSSTNTAGTSHTVTLPSGMAANDLILIIMDIGSTSATLNALTDWGEILDEASANGLKILRYTGTGVPSNPTFTSSANTRDASISFRISGANKAIIPEIGTTGTGTSATPDPPQSAAPSSTKDYLFIAFAGLAGEEADDDTWSDTPPTDYTPTPPLQKSCGTAGTNLGGKIVAAYRQLNTGSAEDPGTFAVDASAAWRSQTIMIHPIVNTTVTPDTLAHTLTTFAPTVTATQNVRVTPSTTSLSTSTFAPKLDLGIIPPIAALSTATFAPSVILGTLATPTTASLSTATFAPQVNLGIIPPIATLSLSTLAPQLQLGLIPSTVALTLTTFAPTVTVESQGTTVTPSTATLTISGLAPQVNLGIIPGTRALSLSTFAPTVNVSNHIRVTPTTPALTTARFAPQLKLGVIPGVRALSLSTFAPSINIGVNVIPATAVLTATGFAPTVTASANVRVTPSTLALALSTFAPSVSVPSDFYAGPASRHTATSGVVNRGNDGSAAVRRGDELTSRFNRGD